LAEELSGRGWQVSLAGGARGLEARLAAAAGLPFFALPARPLLGRGPLGRALAVGTLARGALAGRRLVRRLDADVVVGTGGYASAPAMLGGALARRPLLLLEPNARAGVANRWLARLASEALVAFEATARDLACPSTLTGVPVREAFFRVPERPAAEVAGPPRLLVLGGSQGARQLNELLPEALATLARDLAGLAVRHQSGAAHLEATRRAYGEAGLGAEAVTVTPFIDDVAAAMAEADLVVSRAGALTVAEIAAAGRPSILVPLALAGGHQVDNARALAAAGAARLLAPGEAGAEALAALLRELVADRRLLTVMGRAARALARPGAAAAIALRVEEWSRRRRTP
jgi:UDP-N-acetylglucosamine--N-acetylmuramyl-(pentapeptide) pyrophosphoryl-undecaprenol N-acetylglucosamine transferase